MPRKPGAAQSRRPRVTPSVHPERPHTLCQATALIHIGTPPSPPRPLMLSHRGKAQGGHRGEAARPGGEGGGHGLRGAAGGGTHEQDLASWQRPQAGLRIRYMGQP